MTSAKIIKSVADILKSKMGSDLKGIFILENSLNLKIGIVKVGAFIKKSDVSIFKKWHQNLDEKCERLIF